MMVMALHRPAWAVEAGNSCIDSPLYGQMADLTKGLDDAQTLYNQYLQWVAMIESRTLWQGKIADHRSALQELRHRQAAVIISLGELYSNGDVAFQTGADGKGYTYTNKQFHKGVQPFFPKDLGGEDGTDWNDLINDERAQTSKTLATFIAGKAAEDARASLRYCAANAPSNPASVFVKGFLGLMKPNFCAEETQQCTTTTVQNPVVVPRAPSRNSTPTLIPRSSSRFNSNNPGINNSSDSDNDSTDSTGDTETTDNTTSVETCVCVAREKPNCIDNWAQSFGGLVYSWNEQRKNELNLRGQSIQAMRAIDEINAQSRSLQQAMIAQGATGITGTLSDDDLKAKFLAFHPARYTAIYNQLAQLRQDSCTKSMVRPLTDLYQRVTAEARQYDVALLPTGTENGSSLVDDSKVAGVVSRAAGLSLQPDDFVNLRRGNCGPQYSCVETNDQNVCQRYLYDVPTTIAWAQQNASAIVGNKAKFRLLTCGDATYPLK
jgi:hypothetical protein